MRRLFLLLALLAAPVASAAPDAAPALLLRAAGVGPGPGAGAGDAVLVADGRIVAVGRYRDGYVDDVPVPPGAEVVNVPGGRIGPGLIDAGAMLSGSPPSDEAVTADVRVADGYDPNSHHDRILAAGVTTVALAPGRGRLVPGIGAVVRLGGDPERRVVKRDAALHVVLTEAGRNPPAVYEPPAAPAEETEPLRPSERQLPTTLAGAVLRLRELFALAGGEGAAAPDEPAPDGLPVIARALAGDLPVVFHADRTDEIRAALTLKREVPELKAILAGGEEAGALAKEIAAAGVPVILDTGFVPGGAPAGEDPDAVLRRERALGAAAALKRNGARIAFRASGDPADLVFLASRFLRPGFGPDDLARALTTDAADILGVAEHVGRVAPGLDADLVVTDAGGAIRVVVAGGEIVHREEPTDELLVVAGEKVFTGDGRILPDAGVLVSGDRILEVGAVARPAGARVIAGPVVVPGFVDAHSYLGLLDPEGRGGVPAQLPLAEPAGRVLTPGSPAFAPVVRSGITSFFAAPPGGGLVAGTGTVAHPAGATRNELIVRASAGVVFTVAGTRDLAATMAQLEGFLEQGKAYADAHAVYAKEKREFDEWIAAGKPGAAKAEPKRPATDPHREILREMFEGKLPALVRASSGPKVREVLALFAGKYGLKPLLVGAEGATEQAGALAAAGAAVVLGPRLVVDGPDGPVNLPAVYSRAGVTVLFGSSGTTGAAALPPTVAHAVSRGLGPGTALAGLTSAAADRLGVADRVGRVAPGLGADLLVLSGDPFRPGTRVLAVIRGGRVVWNEKEEVR